MNPIPLLSKSVRTGCNQKKLTVIQPFFFHIKHRDVMDGFAGKGREQEIIQIPLQYEPTWGESKENKSFPSLKALVNDWESAPKCHLGYDEYIPLIEAVRPKVGPKQAWVDQVHWVEIAWPFGTGCLRFYLPEWALD